MTSIHFCHWWWMICLFGMLRPWIMKFSSLRALKCWRWHRHEATRMLRIRPTHLPSLSWLISVPSISLHLTSWDYYFVSISFIVTAYCSTTWSWCRAMCVLTLPQSGEFLQHSAIQSCHRSRFFPKWSRSSSGLRPKKPCLQGHWWQQAWPKRAKKILKMLGFHQNYKKNQKDQTTTRAERHRNFNYEQNSLSTGFNTKQKTIGHIADEVSIASLNVSSPVHESVTQCAQCDRLKMLAT